MMQYALDLRSGYEGENKEERMALAGRITVARPKRPPHPAIARRLARQNPHNPRQALV